MLEKEIIYFGKKVKLICDGKCDKAWGGNTRPKIQLDKDDEDDYVYLSDGELGIAPEFPGTSEGGCVKPLNKEDRLNKWCCRECERSSICKDGEELIVSDYSVRVYNIPR